MPSEMHTKRAAAMGNHNRVWCQECGRSVPVNAAESLANGWPKCHGLTMTIDHPSSWGEDSPARQKALAADAQRQEAGQ